MSDNRRRYRAIKRAIVQLYPTEPMGHTARHLHTLAALISGIVGSKSTNLPAIAGKVPDRAKKESRVKRFSRWIKNERINTEVYFLPYADALLASLAADRTLLVAMDGSAVGRKCLALMVSVIYKKRALPIAWIVIEGNKGHFPEETHGHLLQQVHEIVPPGADVIFVADGEFDGTILQATLDAYGWEYVCRTARNAQPGAEGEIFSFHEVGIQPGEYVDWPDVTFTLQAYGRCWPSPGGMRDMKSRSTWSPTWNWPKKPVIGTPNDTELKPSSPTRRAEGSTCTRATSPIRRAWPVC